MLGNFESIQDINFDLIPNEPDLLSLELNFAFRDLYLNGNMLYYNYVATSLLRLESIYGEFQNIYAKGDGAKVSFTFLPGSCRKAMKIYRPPICWHTPR